MHVGSAKARRILLPTHPPALKHGHVHSTLVALAAACASDATAVTQAEASAAGSRVRRGCRTHPLHGDGPAAPARAVTPKRHAAQRHARLAQRSDCAAGSERGSVPVKLRVGGGE